MIKRGTPNWGHPVLRKLKDKTKTFPTKEAAQAFLMQLHDDYPDVTIPNPGKLFTLIYSRDTKPLTKKYVLEVKSRPDGTIWIDWSENKPKPKPKTPRTISVTAKAEDPPVGKFTTMVEERRAKKKRR